MTAKEPKENMKEITIYLRKLRSGNYRITNANDYDLKFESRSKFESFFSTLRFQRIIKATYSQSQTYCKTIDEVYKIQLQNNYYH